ncbi:1-phosphofructokinase [uncultured Ilyobacter sp.]|uniref:1-phosphofructokinase n=1 Tax=uncultured Ilyobacter sp. TaxID=544433 RepID=UPI0029F4A2A2|nr:1-phosphofructokinase [uncultured Ilyobacter sp.]
MIYTLTLNPSLDYIIQMNSFQEGKVNISKSEHKLPGGKGINVSQVLKNLGHESVALGFLGGFTGDFIHKELIIQGIKCDFIQLEEDTRINVKMKNGNIETEINGNSPKISQDKKGELFKQLEKLKKGDILVMAGSVPLSFESNVYEKVMTTLPKGVKVILDTKGKALEDAVKTKPYLIKPNHHELEELFNVKIQNKNEMVEYGKKLQKMGAKNVAISMAGDGAFLITEDAVYFGNVPKGVVKNSVGAGDSMVGGFTSGIAEGLSIEECFSRGIAAGSASAFSKNLCTLSEVENLINEIKIEKIN